MLQKWLQKIKGYVSMTVYNSQNHNILELS